MAQFRNTGQNLGDSVQFHLIERTVQHLCITVASNWQVLDLRNFSKLIYLTTNVDIGVLIWPYHSVQSGGQPMVEMQICPGVMNDYTSSNINKIQEYRGPLVDNLEFG